MRRTLIVIGSLLGAAFLLCGAVIGGYFDLLIRSGPGNPASGKARVYVDSGTNALTCLLSTGASCMPAGSGASVSGYYLTDGTNYWIPALHLFPATLPNAASFSWLNQGAATETTLAPGALVMDLPGVIYGLRLRTQPAAGISTVTAVLMVQSSLPGDCCSDDNGFGGVGLYESAHSGVFDAIGVPYDGGQISVEKWGSYTSHAFGFVFGGTVTAGQPVALRIQMDSVNHILLWQFSRDGVHFENGLCEAYAPAACAAYPYASVANWDFNVVGVPYWPDTLFYMGNSNNSGKHAIIELLSWDAH